MAGRHDAESDIFLAQLANLPKPAEPARAAIGFERWAERAAAEAPPVRAAAERLAADPVTRRLLECIFGNSPFLTECLLAELDYSCKLCGGDIEDCHNAVMASLAAPDAAAGSTADIMARLRVAKRRLALASAIADIAGYWPLEQVTGALSDFAAAALTVALRHLLRDARSWLEPADAAAPERSCGLFVLGLGKLGARELNYSSDIDLVLLYDEERVRSPEPAELNHKFVRLARALLRMMQERTADGYVFRIDLRLRPDPGATPLVMSAAAAELYYESQGQNWERAAFIKARPVAGDIAAGEAFLGQLKPFLWRKHLDFAAIQDIHSIKRQIHAQRGGAKIAVAGHNLKLGRGGIREIEFFAQTQQLIWGGRQPAMRVRGTIEALQALVRCDHLSAEVAEQLAENYRFLRRVEHRLQMIADQQTHTLPADEAGLGRLAIFLGFPDEVAFAATLTAHLRRVEEHYAELFEEAPDLGGDTGNLAFTGAEHDPSTLETLARMGFKDPQTMSAAVRAWHHGRYRAMRSTRARELLTELTPTLLGALGRTVNPDAAFLSFDRFLASLPSGVQLFSLFYANPEMLELVAEIMGSAPRLAEQLAQHPLLLDAVLSTDFLAPLPPRAALAEDLAQKLAQAGDFQDLLDLLRRWTNDRRFQIGVQMMRGSLDPEAAGPVLADIAETALSALLEPVAAGLAESHGRIEGGGFAVVALGKLGGRELTMGSDLDLLFIYDAPAGSEASDGPRPLAVSQYFVRLSQRLLSAITAPTGEGRLYAVDMRLRPSGEQGPLATSLDGFVAYHDQSAWTWEQMALTRARLVAGPPALARRIEAAIRDILTAPRDTEKLLRDAAAMRARIERAFPTEDLWEGKRVRGGLVDLEFIAQYLELRHAQTAPEVLATNTTEALERLARAGALSAPLAAELVAATRFWRRLVGIMRLALDRGFDEEAAPEGLRQTIARATGAVDFAALKVTLEETASRVRRRFAELIEEPAGRLAAERAPQSTDAAAEAPHTTDEVPS
jgi:glutamate-ammonia-ligase adenylyltransferase